MAPTNQSPKTPWLLVGLLSAQTAIGPLSIDMYLPSLPTIARDLRVDPGAVQATVATFFGGLAVGQLLYGSASDRWGRKGPMLAGLGLFVVASVVCALAPNLEVLAGARLAQALGGCASMVIGRAVVRDHFDHQELARFLSLLMLVAGLAPILAPLIGSGLLIVSGWRSMFWVLALFGAGTALATALLLPESRSQATALRASQEHPFASYFALLSQPRLLGYLLGGALNSACMFTYIASSPVVLIGVYGVSPTVFGLLFGMNSVGLIGAAQVNRMLLRRWSADQVLGASALASLGFGIWLALAAVTGVGGLWGLLAPLFLTVASAGLIQANTMAGGLSVDPTRAGAASALFGATAFGLGTATASLAGALADGTPRPMALVIAACLAGCALVLHALALRAPAPRPVD